MRVDTREGPVKAAWAALTVWANDDIDSLWKRAITTWAQSQRSRRVALRCAWHEIKAGTILTDYLMRGEDSNEKADT